MHIMPRGHIETDPSTSSYSRIFEGSMFDLDSSSVVRSLIESGSFRPGRFGWVVSAWVISAKFWGESIRPILVGCFGRESFRPWVVSAQCVCVWGGGGVLSIFLHT